MVFKFNIKKFYRKNNLGLWRSNIKVILIQHSCVHALRGEASMLAFPFQRGKANMINKFSTTIILCLGDKALREIFKEKIIVLIWMKLELLYITKSLSYKLCLKQQLFSFRMIKSRTNGRGANRFKQDFG